MRILFLACVVILTSCVVPDRHPYAGLLPVSIDLDMTGNFTLTPEGELHLDLAARCTMGHLAFAGECNREVLDGIRVVAHTPWNQNLPGLWTNAWQLRFQVDWKATGVDPLDDDASRLVARPWFVSGTQWTPSPADASAMLKRIGDATETEIDVVSGGAAPSLEIAAFGIDGNTLHTGESNTLRVRVANSGPGTAYRVVATTRSSIEALHGLRLSFGLIKPGADKVRQLQVEIPASETARDTMLVVSLASANGPSPPNVNRRVLIERTVASPVLALQCVLAGRSAGRFDLDAGQAETFRCTIQNTGKADATQVQIETSVNGEAARAAGPSPVQAIPASHRLTIDVPVAVPRTLPIDAAVEIVITARDLVSSHSARTTITGVIRKPRLCIPGQLTHAQYQSKITELRSEMTAGVITQAELDRYDAELVACLK